MKTINIFKQTAILSLIILTVLFNPLTSEALTVEEVTNSQSTSGEWVTDMADILSSATETELNRLIANLEAATGAEMAVVTVPETVPADSPKAFATKLFNYWGVGKAKLDNGILFLVSTGDSRVEIETGLGMENTLPNAQVSNIINTQITPQYKHGNFNRGTLNGAQALITALDPGLIENNSKDWHLWYVYVLSSIALTSIIGGIFWYRKRQDKVFVNPETASIAFEHSDRRDIYCADCSQPMERWQNINLTKAQQVGEKIGAVSYRGYKCSNCSNEAQPYTTIVYASPSSRYQNCPECKELTVTRTEETLEPATNNSKRKLLISDRCHCCDYVREKTEDIPRLRRRSRRSNGSRSSNSSIYYGDSSSGGGYSGGGFGGGSSDGDGAGGSW